MWSRMLVACTVLALYAKTTGAQVPANEQWRTIHTPHFNVHFTRPLEGEARHAAAVAERAYSNLATELVVPRGPVDLVISDGTDVSNGSATVFPSNRVIIYARPPVDETSLESYDDWTVLVLQHEMTHIFHLDRSRGIWSAAQHVFGRNPVLFPNLYTPAWLTEGLAVYYESRFTSGGRLSGSYQSAVARAAAVDHLVPTLDQLSLATSRFPFGESVYVYGSFVWEDLARRHGADRVPAFVERSSGATIPLLLNREAKRSFGETFTHAWDHWRDSALKRVADPAGQLRAAGGSSAFGIAQAHIVPQGGRQILFPRWIDDSTLIYVANNGRESPGLYSATLHAAPRRMARRNSLDANAPQYGTGVRQRTVFSQSEYLDRFHTRGDLYVERGDAAERLTYGKRLSAPDVRADGEIVAVQTVPAATLLVRISADGKRITPLTSASLDSQWTAPRWSPDGSRIVAVRLSGGTSSIVVLDATGTNVRTVVHARAVLRSPTWTPSGSSVLYTSDESGSAQLTTVAVGDSDTVSGIARTLTDDVGGVYGLDIIPAARSQDSVRVVATVLRGDGYHVAIWMVGRGDVEGFRSETVAQPTRDSSIAARGTDASRWAVTDDTSRATQYSPWRTLVPTYWSPVLAEESQGRGTLVGALTSGVDVIGRHSYFAQADVNTRNGNFDALLSYGYGRFINPVISASMEQSWSYATITRGGLGVGDLERRSRLATLHATFVRPRALTYSALTVGTDLEERAYSTSPTVLRAGLDPFYASVHHFPTAVIAAVFSDVQRPTLSISPEDGVTLSGTVRQRWEGLVGSAGLSTVAVASGYKSLDLPGFSHHVLALRLAGGAADSRSPSEYGVGGVNGSALEVVPGISIGSSGRSFPVRGFLPGSETGIRAASASVEYRAPLAIPSRGLGLFPLFVDKASVALFADGARASCPARSTPACSPSSTDGPTLASVGAELDIDSALQFDVPYRFRLGLARPIRGAQYIGAAALTAFLTVGGTF